VTEKYYAHSLDGKPPSGWQPLEEHLKNVAEMARSFADDFGAGDWGYLAGLWHDIGKYSDDFQRMLRAKDGGDAHIEKIGRVDHSTAGAKKVVNTFGDKGKLLAYAIAGHHGGLPDSTSNNACFYNRLRKLIPDHSSCPEHIRREGSLGGLPFNPDTSDMMKKGGEAMI